jgi:hypothetical protein
MTAEALMEVLRSLRSDPAGGVASGRAGSGRRRRKLPRVGLRLSLVILPMAASSAAPPIPQMVRLRNLGPRGLGFIHTQPLALEQQFLIVLPRESGGMAHLLGRVERCRPLEAGTYDIGCSIRLDVPRQEMDHFVQQTRRRAA